MKKLFITFALALALIGQNLQGAETYKTLVCNAGTPVVTYTIPAGELCQVMYIYRAQSDNGANKYSLTATISGTSFILASTETVHNGTGAFKWNSSNANSKGSENLVIAGPATITLTKVFTNDDNFCTLRLIPTPNIGGVGQ